MARQSGVGLKTPWCHCSLQAHQRLAKLSPPADGVSPLGVCYPDLIKLIDDLQPVVCIPLALAGASGGAAMNRAALAVCSARAEAGDSVKPVSTWAALANLLRSFWSRHAPEGPEWAYYDYYARATPTAPALNQLHCVTPPFTASQPLSLNTSSLTSQPYSHS